MFVSEELQRLMDKYLTGKISRKELLQLRVLLEEETMQEQVALMIAEDLRSGRFEVEDDPVIRARLHDYLENAISNEVPVRKIRRMPYRWPVAAAVAALLILTGIWFTHNIAKTRVVVEKQSTHQQGAELVLADGSIILLDSLKNGTVVNTGAVLHNGRLAYAGKTNNNDSALAYNMVRTPNGRQFQVTLPDGTAVWLNAASAVRYPVAFSGSSREVEIMGEAYFEVAMDPHKPFKVIFPKPGKSGMGAVEVLGTHFNVSAYDNEQTVRTTLTEGAVRIVAGTRQQSLRPGQQAIINEHEENIQVQPANIDQVLAWKNGMFHFADDDLESIMRQISRWYNVEVIYEKGFKNQNFGGIISRKSTVSGVLNLLEMTGTVSFRVEGHTIYVKS